MTPTDPVAAGFALEAVCDRFERAWQAGGRPRV